MSVSGVLTNSDYWEALWAKQRRAGGWEEQLRRVSMWKYDRMLCRLLDTAQRPDAEVLELGCAPGKILRRIHRLRPQLRLSGLDYAAEGCRATTESLQQIGVTSNIYFGDVRTAEISAIFDLVVSVGLVEHFDDPSEIVRCHARFCRPGGSVAIAIPNFTSPVVRYFAEKFCPDNLAIHNLNVMNLLALEKACRDAGLVDVRVGGDGGNVLHRWISRQDITSKSYAALASLWNMFAVVVPPQLGWHSNLWATGRTAPE